MTEGAAKALRDDVDLLIDLSDVWSAKTTLYGLGYVHGVYQPGTRSWVHIDHFKAARHEASAYELVPFIKAFPIDGCDAEMLEEMKRYPNWFCIHDDCVLAFVRFDVHHNILFKLDVAPFVQRSIDSALGIGRALSPADHLWFAIHRYYYEVGIGALTSPRVLALIAPMTNDPAVDWDVLVHNANALNASAPCFYWLTFFSQLGATAIPERVLDQLRATLGRSERNWGWQIGRLFDLEEPFPAALLAR